MKKPYLRKYGTSGQFTIWIVDGAYIRKNIDIDFTNFGQHYRHKFIPKNEFWIDQEHKSGDAPFYVDHLLVEYHLMAKGRSYRYAITRADRKERSERRKSSQKLMRSKRKLPPHQLYIRHLKKYSGSVNIYLIDGELVRDNYFIDYTEGGHDKVYSFIPHNEIWIDNDLSLAERKFVILHELTERGLMSQGIKYHPAHKRASEVELHARKNPRGTARAIENAISAQ